MRILPLIGMLHVDNDPEEENIDSVFNGQINTVQLMIMMDTMIKHKI